ncbi:MAG: rhodanese-like domain-containing protein [Planctomycetota bacterium]
MDTRLKKSPIRLLLNILLIVGLASLCGLTWNLAAGKDRHVRLTRDYFTARHLISGADPSNPPATPSGAGTGVTPGNDTATEPNRGGGEERPGDPPPEGESMALKHGLQLITLEELQAYLEDPEGMAVVDARDRDHYEDGHIPGAYYLNRYQVDDLIEGIREELELAFMIIVYCNGGDCEDSIELASEVVGSFGIPSESVYVFEAGMEAWEAAGLPVVKGAGRD